MKSVKEWERTHFLRSTMRQWWLKQLKLCACMSSQVKGFVATSNFIELTEQLDSGTCTKVSQYLDMSHFKIYSSSFVLFSYSPNVHGSLCWRNAHDRDEQWQSQMQMTKTVPNRILWGPNLGEGWPHDGVAEFGVRFASKMVNYPLFLIVTLKSNSKPLADCFHIEMFSTANHSICCTRSLSDRPRSSTFRMKIKVRASFAWDD